VTAAEQTASQEPPGGQTWAQDAVDAAGGLDLLLTDAALGVMHRLRPDSSLLRLAVLDQEQAGTAAAVIDEATAAAAAAVSGARG